MNRKLQSSFGGLLVFLPPFLKYNNILMVWRRGVLVLAVLAAARAEIGQHFTAKDVEPFLMDLSQESSLGIAECRLSDSRFIEEDHPVVALASYPRSGNTMTRYLVEKASGIVTGAVTMDGRLRSGGLKGEGKRRGSIMVKTHEPIFPKTPILATSAAATIYMARDPFRAIVSYYDFVGTGTHDQSRREALKDWSSKPAREFQATALRDAERVGRHFAFWATMAGLRGSSHAKKVAGMDTHTMPVLWARYEDVTNRTSRRNEVELLRILGFAGLNPAEYGRRVRCAVTLGTDLPYAPKKTTDKGESNACTNPEVTRECVLRATNFSAVAETVDRRKHPVSTASFRSPLCDSAVQACLAADCSLRFFPPATLRAMLARPLFRAFLEQYSYRLELLDLTKEDALVRQWMSEFSRKNGRMEAMKQHEKGIILGATRDWWNC